MPNPGANDGLVDPVRISDIYSALQAIEEWLGAVRTVLGRLDPDMILPGEEDVNEIKRLPCPVPIVDGGLCEKLWIKPKKCPAPGSPPGSSS